MEEVDDVDQAGSNGGTLDATSEALMVPSDEEDNRIQDIIELSDGDESMDGDGVDAAVKKEAQAKFGEWTGYVIQPTRVLTHILERISKKWTAAVYGFFKPNPTLEWIDGRECHVFKCAAAFCKRKGVVRRFQDKGDSNSTGNLRNHAKVCFGEEAVEISDGYKDVTHLWEKYDGKGYLDPQSITACFERKGKGSVTYSTRSHTTTETR